MPGLVEEEKLPAGMRWVTAGPAPGPVPALLPAGMREVGAPPSAWAQGDIGQQFDQPAQPAPVSEQPQPPDQTKQPPALLALANRLRAMEVTGQVGALKGVGTIVANLGQLAYPMSVADKISGFSGSPEDLTNRQSFVQAKDMTATQGTMEKLGSAYSQAGLTALPLLASGGAATPAVAPRVPGALAALGRIATSAGKGALWGGGTEAALTGEVDSKTAGAAALGAVTGGTVKAVGEGYQHVVDTRTLDRLRKLIRGSDLTKSIQMGKEVEKALLPFTPRSIKGSLQASEMVKPVEAELNRLGTGIDSLAASVPDAVVDPKVMIGSISKSKLIQGPGSKLYVAPLLRDIASNLEQKSIQTGNRVYDDVGQILKGMVKQPEDPMVRAARLALGRQMPIAQAMKIPAPVAKPTTLNLEQALIARRALDQRLVYGPPKVFKTGEQASDSKVTQQIGKEMRVALNNAIRDALGPEDQAKFDALNKSYSDLVTGVGILEKRAAEQAQSPSLLTRTLDSINIVGRYYGPMTRVIVR